MKKFFYILMASFANHFPGLAQTNVIGPEGSEVFAFQVTKDKEHAVVAFDGGIGLIAIRNNEWINEVKHEAMTSISVLALSMDSSRIYYGTTTGKIGQLTTHNKQQKHLMTGEHAITCLKVISNELMVIGDKRGKLKLWHTKKQQLVVEHDLHKAISAITYDAPRKEVMILTLDGIIRTLTHNGAIKKLTNLGKTAFDMAYIPENKTLHVATKNALHTYQKGDEQLLLLEKTRNNQWHMCTTDNSRLKSPAVAYMNGLIKSFSPYAVFKYKLPTAPISIAYVLADQTNINLLVLGMDFKLYLIRTDQWKMKT